MSKKTQAEVVSTTAAASKAAVANAIFADAYKQNPVPARKDIIARAVSEANLTPKGAATYLQNYRAKNGLVARKAGAVAA